LRIGMQLDVRLLIGEAPSILLALVALHVGRAVAVYACFSLLGFVSREQVPRRYQHVMVLGNIKGALSMAAALALPQDLPYRGRIITIVFGVTFVTLVMQALPLRRVLRLLKVTLADADIAFDTARATLVAARRGLAELEELLTSGLISRSDHAQRRAAFQRRVIEAEEVLKSPAGEAAGDPIVEISLLQAQKSAVLEAARKGMITAAAAEGQVSAFDRELMRLSHGGDH
jgi:CPA1 family monovalent cation:H+ antiporter